MANREELEAERQRLGHAAINGNAEALKELEGVEAQLGRLNVERERRQLASREAALKEKEHAAAERQRRRQEVEEESRETIGQMVQLANQLDGWIEALDGGLKAWRGLVVRRYVADHALGRAHGSDYMDALTRMSWPIRGAFGWLDDIDPAPHTAPRGFKGLVGVSDGPR